MISAILSLFLVSATANGCDDSTYVDVDESLLAVTPDAAPEDSCHWEALQVQNGESENISETKSVRASFSLVQEPGSSIKSVLRDQTKGSGWNDHIELVDDSLTRRQIGWNGNGWRWIVGDVNDTVMPLWPHWLPRRALPDGWSAASGSQPFLPTTSIPQGFAAGIFSKQGSAYALSAWEPLQDGSAPPWETPWELHQITAGASVVFPWIASLQLSETRITRDDQDSLAEQLIALGLASPRKQWTLNGAWSSSRQNPHGGFALGTTWNKHFLDSAHLQITFRQRTNDWTSAWDPTYSPDAKNDPSTSSGTETGAGEAVASLRIPFHANEGRGVATSEAWAAWNPEASTRNLGARGAVEWHQRDARFEARAMHREWINASGGTGFHNFVSVETGLGRSPEWRGGAYRIWETTTWREGLSLAEDTRWRHFDIRPGVQIESVKDQGLLTSAALSIHWRISKCWRLEAESSMPCHPDFSLTQLRWHVTLRYSGRSN